MFCGYCGKENSKDYSFCAGCGKPLEGGTPNQPTQPEDNSKNLNTSSQGHQEVKSNEENIPESKYLSVTWWKECAWPWQARSLDGRTLLGSYETKEKAADVVAKFHGIDRIDLLMITDDSEKKKEDLLRRLRKKATDEEEKVKATKNPEISKSEGAMDGHTSTPPQSETKEHLEAPSLREDVEANNCYNKDRYKHLRFQLIFGSVFGVFSTLVTWGSPYSVVSGIITLVFVIHTTNEMKDYPWR